MHIWPAKGSVQSGAELLRQYTLTVLSIVTALALEQGILAWHHHEQGDTAAREVAQELRANLKEVRQSIADNEARIKPLKALTLELGTALREGRDKADVNAAIILESARNFQLGFALPTLQREAWERALASQSAAYIEPARQGRFSAAYAAQRDIPPLTFQGVQVVFSGSRMIDALIDAQLGRVDPVEYLRVASQYGVALQSVQSNLRELEQQLAQAVENPPARAAVSPPPSAASR